jgi:acyl transferase domain-containing protein
VRCQQKCLLTNSLGGSNGHAIIEAPRYPSVNQTESVDGPVASRVFVVSGHDSKTCKAITKQLSHDIKTHPFRAEDLAYTLASRRSKLPCRLTLRADTLDQLAAKLDAIKSEPTKVASAPISIGFVFTGQGAQWYAMGRELIERYPVFRKALEEADNCISSLGSDWSIIGK